MQKDISYQLNRVDLNLLVAFDTLLKERNVTNAAKALFVSQSAMSRSLKRSVSYTHLTLPTINWV